MARGWESKSVEQQQEMASAEAGTKTRMTPAEIAAEHRRKALLLSRRRVMQQMEVATNPRHREMLLAALGDLDAQLNDKR
jgi:hypothetical protein